MSMIEFNSFEDAINTIQGTKHLLAGNGMSMAYNENIFGYRSLLEAADFPTKHPKLADIFERLKTTDFEKVADSLNFSASIADAYGEQAHAARLREATEYLKTSLIETIRSKHPSDRNELTDAQALNFQRFIDIFLSSGGKLFCLNYDLLAYWGVLRAIEGHKRLNFSDGFGCHNDDYVAFIGEDAQKNINILFPHGTLFFFEKSGHVLKPRSANQNTSIINIINTNLQQRNFPLFVSEGRKEQKFERIRNNYYLNYCFESLSKCEGSFFIYGHSLDIVSDGHILEKISLNKDIKGLYASYYGQEAEKSHIETQLYKIKQLTGNRSDLQLGVFPSNSVKCW